MASLKSYLYGAAPILGLTGATLYERQRALVNMGVLEAAPGRGPGSGVPLTAYNIAAVIIALLATETITEMDERVIALINAPPFFDPVKDHDEWVKAGRPTFCTSAAAILGGNDLPWPLKRRVKEMGVYRRPWRGFLKSRTGGEATYGAKMKGSESPRIEITAALDFLVLRDLAVFTQGALSQAKEEEDEE